MSRADSFCVVNAVLICHCRRSLRLHCRKGLLPLYSTLGWIQRWWPASHVVWRPGQQRWSRPGHRPALCPPAGSQRLQARPQHLLLLLPRRLLLLPQCYLTRSNRGHCSSSGLSHCRHHRSSLDLSPCQQPRSSSCLYPTRRLWPSRQQCRLAPLSRALPCQSAVVRTREWLLCQLTVVRTREWLPCLLAVLRAPEWLPGRQRTAGVGLRCLQQQPRLQLRAVPLQPCCRGSPSRPRDEALGLSRRRLQLPSGSRLAPSRDPMGQGISSRCRAALGPSNSPVPSQPQRQMPRIAALRWTQS